jgi:hypothetical protein
LKLQTNQRGHFPANSAKSPPIFHDLFLMERFQQNQKSGSVGIIFKRTTRLSPLGETAKSDTGA